MSMWRSPATLAGVVLAGGLAACGARDEAGPPNTLTPAEEEAGWQLLFDGETAAGWRAYNQDTFPSQRWEVRDGTLAIVPSDPPGRGGSDLVTEERFEHFELTIDFRLTPVANSGILYRVLERDGDAIWYNAPEFQALDDSAYIADLGADDMHKHLTGDNYDLHTSAMEAANPVGEWNRARVIVDNGHVEHWLNGELTVAYDIESPEWERLVEESKFVEYPEYGLATRGHIGIQDHGDRVYFRNIKIRRLP